MTLENLSSTAQLQFTPLYGSYAQQSLAVSPGNWVSISKSGIIGGVWDWLKSWFVCENEKKDEKKTIILEGDVGGGKYRDYTDGSGWIQIPEGVEVTLPADHKIATMNVINYGCLFDPITSDSQLLWNSENWIGPSTQLTAELLNGSFYVEDDTTSWVSIYTDVAYTGCVPEPSTLLLLGIGIAGLIGHRKKKLSEIVP